MNFSAHFKIDNFKYFIDCLNCLNKLSRDLTKSYITLLKITKDKLNIITKTNGLLDSFYEIHNNELFIEPIHLDQEELIIEINVNTLYDSLNSSIKSEDILIYISHNEEEYLYVKYVDSVYTTINITLKVPILIVEEEENYLPEIPFTEYNVNLSKLQSLSFLLNSLNRIGNTIVELKVDKEEPSEGNPLNRCTLKFKSVGSIANIESTFNNLQIFSSYESSPENLTNTLQSIYDVTKDINVFLNISILNTLFKSIIESNLYNKNKSLIIISIPDDSNNDQYIYIVISIIQLETCQMIFIIPNIKER